MPSAPPNTTPLDQLHSRLAFIYRDQVPASGNHCWTYAAGYSLYLLESGKARFTWDSRHFAAEAGEWCCMPAQQYRYQSFSDDTRLLSVRFEAAWPQSRPLFEDGLPLLISRQEGAHLEEAAAHLLQTRQQADQDTHLSAQLQTAAAWQRFLAVWIETLEQQGLTLSSPTWSDQRLAAMQAVLSRANPVAVVPYPELRKATGLQPTQIDRLFKQQTGKTPKRYLDQRSLERAKSLLDDHHLAVKTIARDLGFTDPGHFTRWFKRLSGQTPRSYRKSGELQL